jgi:sporulation protein YlmC with PRC-barrel domain
MLRFIDEFEQLPVMSIRGSRRISTTLETIIDPHKLSVVGFYCDDRASGIDKILLVEDIREFSEVGLIVDSEENLIDPADLVRLEKILQLNFQIIDKKLVSQSGKKLGKVENYAIDDMTYRIEKLYGRPSVLKTLSTNDYIIARRQIASVNENEVVVKDATIKEGNRAKRPSLNPLSY